MAESSFVLRVLPSTPLEGAFRVHLSPDALDRLALKVGDLCQITADDGAMGYGIAWRATDKMGPSPKLRPARITDMLRNAFGFKESSQATICKTSMSITHANSIFLTDVTPLEYGSADDLEDHRWISRCKYLFINCEALATGVTFDVTATKGRRKRFFVNHVTSHTTPTAKSTLFFCDDKTTVLFGQGQETTTSRPIDVAGLTEQLTKLDRRLKLMVEKPTNAKNGSPYNQHLLLHGFEGTGKSLLLKRLEQTGACHVFKLGSAQVNGSIAAKISTIQRTFQDALAYQPSIVLMDDLEDFAPPDGDLNATLKEEIDKLLDTRVLVVAAARSPVAIARSLQKPTRLGGMIEVPIPDTKARNEILDLLLTQMTDSKIPLAHALSLKTNGFTGQDLKSLVDVATLNCFDRHEETAVPVDHSQLPITMEDFDFALQHVHPTALREIIVQTPEVKWSDICGSEAIKRRCDQILDWPTAYPDLFQHVPPQKGILLYGPPGCSKTLTAQAIAANYHQNFILVRGAELTSMYVGESERAVREVFRKARQATPCVIFFDEIDAIGARRDAAAAGPAGLNVLTTLLNEMDGFQKAEGVTVLAATNTPDVLDPALMRAGRFDAHVYLGPPGPATRRELFHLTLRDVVVADDVDFDHLVADTDGYSGAEIVNMCKVARMGRIEKKIDGGTQDARLHADDFESAMRQTRKTITPEMLAGYDDFARSGFR